MKKLTLTLFLALICSVGFTQSWQIDRLKHELSIAKHDTNRIMIMAELCYEYRHSKPDTAIRYGQQAVDLARRIHYSNGEANALSSIGFVYRGLGDLQQSLSLQQKALSIAEHNIKSDETAKALFGIGATYLDLKDYPKTLNNYKKALSIYLLNNNKKKAAILWVNIGQVYEKMNQLDSALYFTQKGYQQMPVLTSMSEKPYALRVLSNTYIKLNKLDLALNTARMGIKEAIKEGNIRDQGFCNYLIAEVYKIKNQKDSCIYYAKNALHYAQICDYKLVIIDASTLLAELYESKDSKEALYYYKIAKTANGEIYGAKKILDLQKIIAEEQERQRQKEAIRIEHENQLKQYAFLVGLVVLFAIAFLLYLNNRQKQKANILLNEQKEKVEQTLVTLKTTQTQLIQKEKLASLGELTAGIAHEIQNPLNFVNNFSEMSVELIQEIKSPLTPEGGIRDGEKMDMELIEDVVQNLEKINHHGKRASSIVSGMLEHSRTSTGERVMTDLNKLADEYLRLSYHGMRAKNKDGLQFNADYELIADENLPMINVVPQDIGRVLLNLINNAFQSPSPLTPDGGTVIPKRVTVRTQYWTDKNSPIGGWGGRRYGAFSVTDNGTGIPADILPKIFQPFFTTKPTGEGTGLGLSLAYDIVTKGHGGTMEVESVEGEGTTFIVKLPI